MPFEIAWKMRDREGRGSEERGSAWLATLGSSGSATGAADNDFLMRQLTTDSEEAELFWLWLGEEARRRNRMAAGTEEEEESDGDGIEQTPLTLFRHTNGQTGEHLVFRVQKWAKRQSRPRQEQPQHPTTMTLFDPCRCCSWSRYHLGLLEVIRE
jgi:hypothetical protein